MLLRLPRLHVLELGAVAADVLLGRVDVVGGGDPVEGVGVIAGLVGIVGDLVVAQPLEGDVPVAVAQHARHQASARLLRVLLPRGRPHELVLAAAVTGGADHHGGVLGAELAQAIVEPLEEHRRTVAHDGDEVGAGGRVLLALLQPFGEGGHQRLHLIGVVLADELEVHPVLAHEAVRRRLLATSGEDEAHLGVPGPVIEADLRLVRATGPRFLGACRARERAEQHGAGENRVSDRPSQW